MFAILITEENMPMIRQNYNLPEKWKDGPHFDIFLASTKAWYFISGFVPLRGGFEPWAIQPAHKFEKVFEYDAEKIKHDWTMIVRR